MIVKIILVILLCLILFGGGRWVVNVAGVNSENECEKLGYEFGRFENSLLKCYNENGYALFYDANKKFLEVEWKETKGDKE